MIQYNQEIPEPIEPQQDWHAIASARQTTQQWLSVQLGLQDWRSVLSTEVPEWLLPGFLQRSSLHILTSDSGCCKTWLGLSMMLSGLYGIEVLGAVPEKPFSSVYLAADSPRWDIKQQLSKLCAAHSLDPTKPRDNCFILPLGFRFDSPDHVRMMSEHIRTWDIDALFIDVLLYAHEGDENDNGYMARTVLKNAKLLRDLTDCAIFFIHHNAKPRPDGSVSFRGAGTLVQAVEHHFALTKRGSRITLEVKKIRGDELAGPSTIDFQLARVGTYGRRIEVDTTQPAGPSVEALLTNGPLSRNALLLKTGGSSRILDNKLQYLRRLGVVRLNTQGEWELASLNQ